MVNVGVGSKSCASSTARTQRAMSGNPIWRFKNLSTAASFAALNTAPLLPPRSATSKPKSRAGKVARSGCSNVHRRSSRQFSRLAGPDTRFGYSNAYWIGSRMSGGEHCASTDPSANSTNEWTTDSG